MVDGSASGLKVQIEGLQALRGCLVDILKTLELHMDAAADLGAAFQALIEASTPIERRSAILQGHAAMTKIGAVGAVAIELLEEMEDGPK